MRRLAVLVVLAILSGVSVPASAAPGVVGFVGCSQTVDVARGVDALGVEGYWSADDISRYPGGTVLRWGRITDRSKYWQTFNAAATAHPDTTDVWFEVCVKDSITENERYNRKDSAERIVAEIKKVLPGVVVHISAMNEFDPVGLCTLSGPTGPTIAQDVADHVVATGEAVSGPVVGPLNADTTRGDNCHANQEGQLLQAEQLDAYFFGE